MIYTYQFLRQNPNGRVHIFFENLDNTDLPNIGDLDFPLTRLNNTSFVNVNTILRNRNGLENAAPDLLNTPTTSAVADSLISNYPHFMEWVQQNARIYSQRKEQILHNYSSVKCLSPLELSIANTLANLWGVCLSRQSFVEKPAIYAIHRYFTTSGNVNCCYNSTTCTSGHQNVNAPPMYINFNPITGQPDFNNSGAYVGQSGMNNYTPTDNFAGECSDSYGPEAIRPRRHLLVDFKNRVFNSSRTFIHGTITNWIRAQQSPAGKWTIQFQQGSDATQTVNADQLIFKTSLPASARIAAQLNIPNFSQIGINTDGTHPRSVPTYSDYRAVIAIPQLPEVVSGAMTLPGIKFNSGGSGTGLASGHLQWLVRWVTTKFDPYTGRTAPQGQDLLVVNGVNTANRRRLRWSAAINSFISDFNPQNVEYAFLCAWAYIVGKIVFAITGNDNCVPITQAVSSSGGTTQVQILFDAPQHYDGVALLTNICTCLFSDSLTCTNGS